NAKSFAVSGVPSGHFGPFRSRNVYVVPSPEICHDSASSGAGLTVCQSRVTSESKIWSVRHTVPVSFPYSGLTDCESALVAELICPPQPDGTAWPMTGRTGAQIAMALRAATVN